jgi:hypothetical protein
VLTRRGERLSGFTKLTETLSMGLNPSASAESRAASAPESKHGAESADAKPSVSKSTLNALQRSGADHMARIINTIFSLLISIIRKHGGDVIKFAGDALMAIWRPAVPSAQARQGPRA